MFDLLLVPGGIFHWSTFVVIFIRERSGYIFKTRGFGFHEPYNIRNLTKSNLPKATSLVMALVGCHKFDITIRISWNKYPIFHLNHVWFEDIGYESFVELKCGDWYGTKHLKFLGLWNPSRHEHARINANFYCPRQNWKIPSRTITLQGWVSSVVSNFKHRIISKRFELQGWNFVWCFLMTWQARFSHRILIGPPQPPYHPPK